MSTAKGLPSNINPDLLKAHMMKGASFLQPEGMEGVPWPAVPAERAARFFDGQEYKPARSPEGVYVDFTGCETMLAEFCKAAAAAGRTPADGILDLVYLYVEGKLCLREEL